MFSHRRPSGLFRVVFEQPIKSRLVGVINADSVYVRPSPFPSLVKFLSGSCVHKFHLYFFKLTLSNNAEYFRQKNTRQSLKYDREFRMAIISIFFFYLRQWRLLYYVKKLGNLHRFNFKECFFLHMTFILTLKSTKNVLNGNLRALGDNWPSAVIVLLSPFAKVEPLLNFT